LVVGLSNNFIINVSDVHAQPDIVAKEISQDALYYIKSDISSIRNRLSMVNYYLA